MRDNLFETAFTNSPRPMGYLDSEGNWIRVNDALADLLGYEVDELKEDKTLADIIHQNNSQSTPLDYVINHELEEYQTRSNITCKDGSGFKGRLRLWRIEDDSEDNPIFQAVIRKVDHDINRKKLTTAIDASIDGISILNENEEFIYVNPSHADIYGYESPDEMVGQNWRILYEGEELERFEESIIPRLYKNGYWRGEATGIKKDGSTFPQEVTLTELGDGGMICVVRDISERKQIMRRIERYSTNLEHAQKLANIGFWHDDIDHEDPGMSYEACRMHGLDPNNMQDFDFEDYLDLVHEEDLPEFKEKIDELMDKGNPTHMTYRIVRPDNGQVRYIENFGTMLPSSISDKPSFFGVYQDITKMKKTEQQLRKAHNQVKTLLQEVHHRVKNNLATVSGLLELQSYGMENDEAKDALQEGLLRVKAMANVHEALYKSPSLSDIQLEDYLKDLAESIENMYSGEDKDIDLNLSISSDIKINLDQAVPSALLVNELMVNAYKHAFDEGEEGRINIVGTKDGDVLSLRVEDDGKGLDKEQWNKSNSLGSSIVDSLTQQLEADLDIIVDDGTCFKISFKIDGEGTS